jgi:cytoskeletal protein CcmA (bactofilin family)
MKRGTLMKSRRGFSLGNTLVVIGVASTLAFTVAAGSMVHLNYTTRVSNGEQAQNLAESTLALAIEKLFKTPTFGTNRAQEANVVLLRNGGVGRLTFNQTMARDWEMPYSTNNLEGSNPVTGFDLERPIPKASTQLVASATVGGVRRTVEAVLYVPPFPYAIASAGPFRSTGKLEVGAVTSVASVQNLAELDPSNLLAAHLASNATGSQALVLGPETRITGDVRAAGQVELDKDAHIGGEVRSGSDPVSIPKENVATYDPELLGKPNIQFVDTATVDNPTFSGFAKRVGDLTVSNGLDLDNGVLYVDGNVNVHGGVQGSGALFVTKNLSITGSSTLSTDNTVAVMAGGDVSIVGSGSYSSSFQGLLYNEGKFFAKQISLMGVFIQNNPNATVEIQDAKLIYAPEYSSVDINVTAGPAPPVDLTKGNIKMKKDGDGFKPEDPYGSSGPVIFEAYPVTTGGWELADPNDKTVTWYKDYAAMRKAFADRWNAYYLDRNKRELLGIAKKTGEIITYGISSSDETKLGPALDAQLNGVAPRPPASSTLMPKRTGEEITLDPSRFLSMKDRTRVLYWRAR